MHIVPPEHQQRPVRPVVQHILVHPPQYALGNISSNAAIEESDFHLGETRHVIQQYVMMKATAMGETVPNKTNPVPFIKGKD